MDKINEDKDNYVQILNTKEKEIVTSLLKTIIHNIQSDRRIYLFKDEIIELIKFRHLNDLEYNDALILLKKEVQ